MKAETIKKVIDAWNHFEKLESDISTERLLAQVCDKTGLQIEVVCEALRIFNEVQE